MANSAKYNVYKIPTEGEFDDKYVDFSSAQSITGTKTFNTIKATSLYIDDELSWYIVNYTNHGRTWELLAPDSIYSVQLGDCGFTVDTREDYNMFQVDNAGVHIGRGRLDDTDYPVDRIVNSIDSSSTDKQLATAKAIFSLFQFAGAGGDFKKFNFIQQKPTDAENRRSGYYIVDGAAAKFGLPSDAYQWGTIVQYYNDSTATAISGEDNKSFVQIYFPDKLNYFYIRSFFGNENTWLNKWNVSNGVTGNITWGWHKISASSNEINMGSGLSFSNNTTTGTMYIPAAFSLTDILHFLKIMQGPGYDMTPSLNSTRSSYVQIGNILICWGICHPDSVGNDTTTTVLFPKSFYWYPTVVMQNTNKIGIEYRNGQVLTGVNGSSFSYYNSASEISNILWIAIGKAGSF